MNTYKITIYCYDDSEQHSVVLHEKANNAFEACSQVCPQYMDTSKQINGALFESGYSQFDDDGLNGISAVRVE